MACRMYPGRSLIQPEPEVINVPRLNITQHQRNTLSKLFPFMEEVVIFNRINVPLSHAVMISWRQLLFAHVQLKNVS